MKVSVERTVQGWTVMVDGVEHSTFDDPDRAEIEAGWLYDGKREDLLPFAELAEKVGFIHSQMSDGEWTAKLEQFKSIYLLIKKFENEVTQ